MIVKIAERIVSLKIRACFEKGRLNIVSFLKGGNFEMLSFLGFCMIATFLLLVISKRFSVIVAFVFVAVAFALIGGFSSEMGKMMFDGIITVAPTAIMIVFAILYFGLMIDVGLFDPMIA